MLRARALIFALTLAPLALACKKAESTSPDDATPTSSENEHGGDGEDADEFAGREVVNNWEAQPGDVTVCPISGKKFEVDDKSGHFSYQGYDFVFCCSGGCIDKVEADPGKYLAAIGYCHTGRRDEVPFV